MPPDTSISLGDSILLIPTINFPPDTFFWSSGFDIPCSNCKEILVFPTETSTYTFTAQNEYGCISFDEITIRVHKALRVFFPNVFSPNNDGRNDFFYPLSNNQIKAVRSLAIYSRWGEKLFEQKNFQPNNHTYGWDGTFNGEVLNNGVFVWIAEVEFLDNSIEIMSGDITLLR